MVRIKKKTPKRRQWRQWIANFELAGQFVINSFQSSVVFQIETSHLILLCKSIDWFLYKIQHWAETG